MNVYLKNVTVALLLLLFCFISLQNLAFGLETSTQMGALVENGPEGTVASEVANLSQVAGFETFNYWGPTFTVSDIYSAAAGSDSTATSSIAFYIGEGGKYLQQHYGFFDEYQYALWDEGELNPAWDYNIAPQASSTGIVNFAFIWACYQGNEIGGVYVDGYEFGMPRAWLGSSVTSTDGYHDPDTSNKAFIGFNGTAPYLSQPGADGNNAYFIMNFYMAAVSGGNIWPVNVALDYASYTAFLIPSFDQTQLWTGTFYSYNEYNPLTGHSTYVSGHTKLEVYGDGWIQLSSSGPLFDLKTPLNGWPYMPAESASFLRIEDTFATDNLAGDITGYNGLVGPSLAAPGITNIPDGYVNMKDQAVICRKFGLTEGQSGWDYMADINPDKIINMKDIAIYARTFGNSGTYISPYLNGIMDSTVTVKFYIGGLYQWDTRSADALGFVPIPFGTATNFTVELNGNPVSALVTFWNP